MGFGGINTHVVLERNPLERRRSLSPEEKRLLHSAQDVELFLLGAKRLEDLLLKVGEL